jgi:signal transduction histidine kinase
MRWRDASWRSVRFAAGLVCAGLLVTPAWTADVRGLPFIRTYSLDEIGSIPRGLRLGFDSFGRFAVMYDGIYSVLNDSVWVDRIDATAENRAAMTVVRVVDGTYYFAGRGTWGIVEQTPQGRLRPRSLVPPDAPAWTKVTAFNEVAGTRTGVYFYELNGVVYWDFARQRSYFFELPRVAACFRVGDQVFVSCQDGSLREILPETGSIRLVNAAGMEGVVVHRAATLGESGTLLSLQDGRLVTFDGRAATPWAPQAQFGLNGGVSALTNLAEGGVAIGINSKGLFLIGADGALKWRLPPAEFNQVSALAANEPGVLWVAGENAVHKVFYDSPLTSFGQPLGISAAWPDVGQWDGGLVVSSGTTLYQLQSAEPGAPSRFKALAGIWEGSSGSLAAHGPHLLIGNAKGIVAIHKDSSDAQIIPLENVASLDLIEPNLCIAVGSREIAALRYTDGRWRECAPRIAGVGDAPVHTTVRRALWIEMGGDQVARLTLHEGRLTLERIALPWSGGSWTNVGAIGPIIVLSSDPAGHRAYYDESREMLCPAPELDALLNRSPYWIARTTEDESGTLWATHSRGVVTFTPGENGFVLDATTYELRNDSYPTVKVLAGNDTWIGAGRSLYHVERQAVRRPSRPNPALVSLVADQQNLEMVNQTSPQPIRPEFSFNDHSLSYRFFSGTYAWRSPPLYQYRLGASETWTPVDPGLVLRLPKLRDGAYVMEVREAVPHDVASPPFAFAFVINPPWYRTTLSYAAYAVVLLLSLLGVARWINRRTLRRNAMLERLVHERTKELEVTMGKLGEETRNAATLAERNRLAGEIHDSLEQGFSALSLQLETTANLPDCPPAINAGLSMARNMVIFSRNEVRNAVWDLHSPRLEAGGLVNAVQRMLAQTVPASITATVNVEGSPNHAGSKVEHHLLRIAQEAVANAVKHGHPHRIDLRLSYSDREIHLSVRDDGHGFDARATLAAPSDRFGLKCLKERASKIGGSLKIDSSPGAGTCISIGVPATRNAKL